MLDTKGILMIQTRKGASNLMKLTDINNKVNRYMQCHIHYKFYGRSVKKYMMRGISLLSRGWTGNLSEKVIFEMRLKDK